jgi:hypothetical protein
MDHEITVQLAAAVLARAVVTRAAQAALDAPVPMPPAHVTIDSIDLPLYWDEHRLLPRLRDLAAEHGVHIDIQRMQFDRIYGIETLVDLHALDAPLLQSCAVTLMGMYEAPHWGPRASH